MGKNTTKRMGYEKKNARRNLFSILIAVFTAGIIFAFFCAVNIVSSGFDVMLSQKAQMLTNWRYSNQQKLNNNVNYEKTNNSAYYLTFLKKYADGNYIYLTTQIPASATSRKLILQTYYNPVKVMMNGKVVFDNLNTGSYFGDGVVNNLEIPVIDNNVTLNIAMKSMFQPRLNVFVVEKDYFGVPLTLFSLLGLLLTLFTFILSIIYVKKGMDYRKSIHNNWLVISGLAGIIFCLPIIMEYLFLLLNLPVSVIQMRFNIFCYMLAGLFGYWRVVCQHTEKIGFYRWLFTVGILYSFLTLALPFEAVIIELVKWYGLFYLLICLPLFRLLYKKYFWRGAKVNQITLSSVSLLFISYIAYWACYWSYASIDLTIAVVISFLQQAFIFYSMNQPVKDMIHAEETDLMQFKPENLGSIDDVFDFFMQNRLNLNHVRNVSQYVYVICLESGMSAEESEEVAKASFLHDIGKTMVSVKIITKSEALTSEEYEQMKQHPRYGYELLSSRSEPFFKMAALIAQQHHERYDGKGYYGFASENIDKYARIICIADVFDGLTTERTYKNAWTFDEALEYIMQHSGTIFDPYYVDCFIKAYNRIFKIYCDAKSNNTMFKTNKPHETNKFAKKLKSI